ncbi:hypothetical protein ACQ4PT_062741 [Festuca glaucescens]
MGKKKSGNAGGGGGEEVVVAREFVLKVAMHCSCNGCKGKVRAAVRDITLARGVEAADSSAAESSGEVRLLATADPERLRRRLRKATGKKVDLLLPKEPAPSKKQENADAAALQALLAELQLLQAPAPARQQYGGQGAAAVWAANQQQQLMGLGLGGGGWNGGAGGYGAAYPWPSPSASSYYSAAPTTSWGTYGYAPPAPAPVHGSVGHYGSAPAWLGY